MKAKSYLLLCAAVAMQLVISPADLEAASKKKQESLENSPGYTINFDNVPIKEFLKFISKVAGLNVIYNESDLDFNVTIVSEEQTDLNNILSALVQVLRINGLTLIEEEKNLLIHKNDGVRQIPTVVSSEYPLKGKIQPAVMTKVFKIKKGNPSSIAALLIPMLSSEALVEVSSETRQLIITDISTSMQTIEQLLLSLDAPETPYDVDAFRAKHASVAELAVLAKQILAPMTDSTPLEILPQPNTQTIYIVSTPFLIDKTLAILEDLDKHTSSPANTKNLASENVFVYKLQYKSPADVEADLKNMIQGASLQGFESSALNTILTNMKYIKSTNSLMFVGSPQDLAIIESFLKNIDLSSKDVAPTATTKFLVYNIKEATEEQMSASLNQLATYLKSSPDPNTALIQSITSMRWIKSTNSLLFMGNPATLQELSEFLPSFDVPPEKSKLSLTQVAPSTQFLMYTPKELSASHLKTLIDEMAKNLKSADLSDPAFLKTLESVKNLPSSNQLIFTGDPASLTKLTGVLQHLDQKPGTVQQSNPAMQTAFFHVQNRAAKDVVKILQETADKLAAEPNAPITLVQTLKGAQWMASSNTIILSGSLENLQKAKELIEANDTLSQKTSSGQGSYFIHLKYADATKVKSALHQMAETLAKNDPVREMVQTMHYLPDSNAFVFKGSESALKQIQEVINITDVESVAKPGKEVVFVQVMHKPAKELVSLLHETAEKLASSSSSNPELIQTLKTADSTATGNTIILTGSPANIQKAHELITANDTLVQTTSNNMGPYFIHLKYADATKVKSALHQMVENLAKNDPVREMVQTMLYLPDSNAFVFKGSESALKQIQEVINITDVESVAKPGKEVVFVQVMHKPAKELVSLLHETAEKLASSSSSNPELIQTLKTADSTATGNTIILTGSPANIQKAHELITANDTLVQKTSNNMGPYFIHLKYADADKVKNALSQMAHDLSKNDPIYEMVQTMSYLPDSNVLVFRGPESALQRVQEVIELTDTADVQQNPNSQVAFFHVHNKPAKEIVDILHETADKLSTNASSPSSLVRTLKEAQWMSHSNTIIVSGSPENLLKAKELIESNDSSLIKPNVQEAVATGKDVVFVQVTHRSAKEIASILHETAATLAKNTSSNPDLIQTLKTADATATGNTIILSGTDANILKAKELIQANDIEQVQGAPSEVFVYKLRYLTPVELQTALRGIVDHADNSASSSETIAMSKAIDTMRSIPDSNAVQFVASPAVITKIKDILTILDSPENTKSPIKQQNGSNFLVYKVKNLNPQDLLAHLKQIVKQSPNHDSLMKSVSSAQYVTGSNSLVFTGSKADLDKIHTLLDSLDQGIEPTKISPTRQAEEYKIYKPQHVPGQELIQMVKNFEDHLVASGVSNPRLGEVIGHLSYIDRTNTIIITGKESDIAEVIHLLKEFDTQETASGKMEGQIFKSDIETIDDTGFLIYKLQHQSGSGIVQALTVISSDLNTQTSQKKNEGLIEAIRSTQWIEPTNSLIATGQPRVLTKLKELISSIDQPLKQVFIEVLVLETNNTSDLEFGLRWGSQGAVHNKFSWGSGNYPPLEQSGGFPTNLNQITGTRLPTGSDIPPIHGGFLGVIGDIIWHQGKSYAALGSLLNAIKSDGNITVVLSQKIVAQDNQNAKIFSGDNVPFTGSLVTTSGLSQTTNANLEYRNIGVTLNITPIIGDNDIITLDIDHEISEIANQADNTGNSGTNPQANNVNGIQTTKTSMQTRVHMPNEHFLVLSGTMRNQVTRSVSGIPCLGGLPLVGAAFSETTKETVTRNVIVFVKPHIIKSDQIYGTITKNQEELFGSKDQANPADFSKGLELIRSPDDKTYEETE